MAKASELPVPSAVDELSREGAIFLLGILAPVIRPSDLVSARWHELVLASERATKAWKAACAEADTACAAVSINSKTYHRDCMARDAARAKERRLWRASERAYEASTQFFEAHIAQPRRDLS